MDADDLISLENRRDPALTPGGRTLVDGAAIPTTTNRSNIGMDDNLLDPSSGAHTLSLLLSSSEESAVQFAQHFSSLNDNQKARLMLGFSAGDADGAVLVDVDNDEEVQARGREFREALEQLEDLTKSAREAEERAAQGTAAVALSPRPLSDDLEVVELDSVTEVRTGAMVGFWKDDWTAGPVTAAFDNFMDESPAVVAAQQPLRTSSKYAHVPPPDLDDFLNPDCDADAGEEAVPSAEAVAAMEAVAAPMARGEHRNEEEEEVAAAAKEHSELSSLSSSTCSLPGLEGPAAPASPARTTEGVAVDDTRNSSSGHTAPPSTVDGIQLAALKALMAEADDCVHDFALDATFDYDADLLGPTLRAQSGGWRQ